MVQKIIKQLRTIRTYKIWIVQFLIVMIGGYAINKLSSVDILSKESIKWWVLIIILGGIELIVIAYANIKKEEEDLRRISRMAYLHFDSQENLNQQISFNEQFYKNKDYFKLLLAHLRTGTEVNKFSNIANSHIENWVLLSLPMWDYFISIFRSLINELIEKDEYLTLSIIDFWNKDKDSKTIGLEQGLTNKNQSKNFFESNFLKCSKGNVSSKRIIVVNLDKIKKGKKSQSGPDREYYLAFRQILKKFADENFEHKYFFNRFYLVNEEVYKNIIKEDIPFALVQRQGYSDKLCVSTYIPNLHSQEFDTNSRDGWRNGNMPKIGMHIAPSENDEIWIRLFEKFDNIYNESKNSRKGLYMKPKDLRLELDTILS